MTADAPRPPVGKPEGGQSINLAADDSSSVRERSGRRPSPRRRQRVVYRVQYRRTGWAPRANTSAKIINSTQGVRNLIDKLGRSDFDLSPLEFVTVEAREVAPWRPLTDAERLDLFGEEVAS